MLNSIYEERKRIKDGFHVSLLIPRNEYTLVYGETMSKENAGEIVEEYLQKRDDDGKPCNIELHDYKDSCMVEIELNLHYLSHEHTDYIEHVSPF